MDMNKYNFYMGTARGVLIYTQDKLTDLKVAKPEEASEVTALIFGRSENEVILGYENGTAKIYDTGYREFTNVFNNLEGEGRVVGIGCRNKTLIFGKQDGIINTWNGKNRNMLDINLEERSTLDCLVLHGNRHKVIGTGGECNDFRLWDIETHQNIFKAKSLGHDKLNLPIPTSVRGITFFPEDEHLSGCATKEGHVLLYDDRAQRRPVVKFLEPKASYTAIACAHRERQCLVGTTRGYMQLLDMKAGKCLKTFTSFLGSVTDIVCDPTEPYVATTSLDRFLRVHDLETKQLLHKVYMKQNLTKILMRPVIKEELLDKEIEMKEKEIVDEEYEDIFNGMDTVTSDKKLKKQREKVEESAEKRKKKKKRANS